MRTGQWVGDCFLYTNSSSQRLQYYVGGQVMTLCHLDRPMYLLGYLSKEDRVYLMDKQLNIVSYKVRGHNPSVLSHIFSLSLTACTDIMA